MSEGAVLVARFVQFLAAALLFGGPLFFVYASCSAEGWPRRSFAVAAAALAAAALAALSAQTASMTGDPKAGLDPACLWLVASETQFGRATAVRIAAACVALVLAVLSRAGRRRRLALAAAGGAALASFAWSGHGAADDGLVGVVHLGADLLHLLTAGIWIGALLLLLRLVWRARSGVAAFREDLHAGLLGFSGVGGAVVGVLVLTGLVNTWLLVGPGRIGQLFASPYGVALFVKLILFALMVGLAALNRLVLTGELAASLAVDEAGAIHRLRASLALETAAGVLVIGLVSLLGTLEPPSSMG